MPPSIVQNQKMSRIRNTASATLAPNATSANKVDPITNASVPILKAIDEGF